MKSKLHSEHYHQKKKQNFLSNERNCLLSIHSNSNQDQIQIEEMRQELKQALYNIRYIAAHCAHQAFIETKQDEWKFVATVIDRLQFLIFLTITILGSFILLFQVKEFLCLIFLFYFFFTLGTSYIFLEFN